MLSFWHHRRVLVTGATGLVGGYVLESLLRCGADVVGLVRDEVSRARAVSEHLLDHATVVHGLLEDHPLLERILHEYEITCVIHLAAQTIVGTANASPLSTFESNIRGTWNLLEACRSRPAMESVVIASSDKAYGEAQQLPYDENHPLRGAHPYDVSKSCADLLARAYFLTYRLPVVITRCGNFYGGGDLNFNRLVPGTIRSALHGEAPVLRSDGTPRRDYIYVEDAADAYLLLAERAAVDTTLHGEAFNFSNETPRTAVEMMRAVLESCGRGDLKPVVSATARHEIPHQFLSARKARELLGWQPRFTHTAGLERTVAWYRRHFDSLRTAQGAQR